MLVPHYETPAEKEFWMSSGMLKKRWKESLKGNIPKKDFEKMVMSNLDFWELFGRYSEPERHYHNTRHLVECFKEFDEIKHMAEYPEELKMAIFGHDVIYDSTRKNNEEHSANYMCDLLRKMGTSQDFAERVKEMILVTDHISFLGEQDEAFLVDIDLSILGQNKKTFEEYDKNIRKEYSWIPENEYKKARGEFIESFLHRPGIYQTDHFKVKYEDSAKKNLERSLKKLS